MATKRVHSLVTAGKCMQCEEPIVYDPDRYAWTHQQPGADHGPQPNACTPRKPRKETRNG